jgi:hypothetical protein
MIPSSADIAPIELVRNVLNLLQKYGKPVEYPVGESTLVQLQMNWDLGANWKDVERLLNSAHALDRSGVLNGGICAWTFAIRD